MVDSASTVAFRVAVRTLSTDLVTVEVVSALEAAGIACLVLKGPALAEWLYPDSPRFYGDSDVMVSEDSIDQAEKVLRDMGFEHPPLDDIPHDKPWHAHAWVRPGTGSVDLHRTLIGAGAPPAKVWRVLSERTDVMQVGGREVTIPEASVRAMHVALHAAQDGARNQRFLEDLERAVEQPLALWEQANEIAERIDAVPSFAAGLRMLPAGTAVAERLALPAQATIEISLRASGSPPEALGLAWLASRPGVGNKLVFAARKLIPPPSFMRAWTPLARTGPPGLVAAYVWRWLWLVVKTPPAVRAWWRARGSVDKRAA